MSFCTALQPIYKMNSNLFIHYCSSTFLVGRDRGNVQDYSNKCPMPEFNIR